MFPIICLKKKKGIKLIKKHINEKGSHVSEDYEDIIRSVGAPTKTITDNSKAKQTTINRKYCIKTGPRSPIINT